jgi:ABC-type multidrug transport system ATPase subunit
MPAESDKESTVMLRNLQKMFTTEDGRRLAAVRGVTVNLYEGEIFILLGHNGAGKTTTINMLCGMLPFDGGGCIMYGKSALRDMTTVRTFLGICPQHDVIWNELTVSEHLSFFARAKAAGTDWKEKQPARFDLLSAISPFRNIMPDINDQVTEMIADIGLQEKTRLRWHPEWRPKAKDERG